MQNRVDLKIRSGEAGELAIELVKTPLGEGVSTSILYPLDFEEIKLIHKVLDNKLRKAAPATMRGETLKLRDLKPGEMLQVCGAPPEPPLNFQRPTRTLLFSFVSRVLNTPPEKLDPSIVNSVINGGLPNLLYTSDTAEPVSLETGAQRETTAKEVAPSHAKKAAPRKRKVVKK